MVASEQAWEAPREGSSERNDPEVDEATIQSGLARARIVAVGLLLCGLMYGANVLQVLLFAWQEPLIIAGEVAFVLLCVLHIFVGSRVYDGLHLATIAAVPLSLFGALFSAFWFVFILMYGGALSVLSVMVAGASLLCVFACLLLLPSTAGIAAARRRLFEDG